ncbi:MAG: hypothetical protein CL920_05990 [Deltaproteobacteria bacterium]|nr:hypothetical protein [Deltaproteobacteria bacterium]MBU48229.1 hypothetical protein [Deltaproteobacteria bacterium]|tara:strand:+ start:8655 stop:9572 length:918 start_codon:yes stop_codon:yes gene_type:complete
MKQTQSQKPPLSFQDQLNILCIDDDQVDYFVLKSMLKRSMTEPYQLEWQNSAHTGLKSLLNGTYDVCLLDYHLPPHTGFEILQQAQDQGNRTPVIMLTGNESPDIDKRAMEQGVYGFLHKEELEPTHLERTIRYALKHHKTQEELRHKSERDALTGLYNIQAFHDIAEERLQHLRLHDKQAALLFIDLDRFKQLNDQQGHLAGNKFLQSLSQALTVNLRATDLVARVGGDEFVVLLEEIPSLDVAYQVAQRLMSLPKSISTNVGMSIGISMFPQDSHTLHGLLMCADKAMYQRKKSGGQGIKTFS